MEIKLENESLELTINSFGAELKSITGKAVPVCRQLKGQDVFR